MASLMLKLGFAVVKIIGFDYSHFVKQNRAGMSFTEERNEGC